jgi:hypothetical protein
MQLWDGMEGARGSRVLVMGATNRVSVPQGVQQQTSHQSAVAAVTDREPALAQYHGTLVALVHTTRSSPQSPTLFPHAQAAPCSHCLSVCSLSVVLQPWMVDEAVLRWVPCALVVHGPLYRFFFWKGGSVCAGGGGGDWLERGGKIIMLMSLANSVSRPC